MICFVSLDYEKWEVSSDLTDRTTLFPHQASITRGINTAGIKLNEVHRFR